jgi:hypothetical protein
MRSLSLLSSLLRFLSLAVSTGFLLLAVAPVPAEFGTDRYWLEVAETFCRRRELLVAYEVVSSLTCTQFKMISQVLTL